jgi:ribosomal protein S18 acetylase RimI-like enzyme
MGNLSSQQFGDYELRHRQEDQGERKPRHVIEAFQPRAEKPVGRLAWYGTTGTISNVDVDAEHSRRGIATAMWHMGQEARPRPKHSADRTAMGDAWARKVGGRLPRKVRP